ncbi:MAG TPA: alginate lyase family protein [Candidatus Hydrogenedentes bacterium]|mgnify:CR=1 FL=1|nr:alginate lyase family protein [Candidatus Hydrogenedentota bacterium]HPG65274.1 alginate lyase family protein [Candidatus Hydrogenedentota bacterium]
MRNAICSAMAPALLLAAGFMSPGGLCHAAEEQDGGLKSLKPGELFDKLDLTRPGIEAVKERVDAGQREEALAALLAHYRAACPRDPITGGGPFETADRTVHHVFQWGPYEPADYGQDIHWEWDPRGDIEWVAAVYRFYWAAPLADAYRATRDEKYAQAFVDLTRDWIAKHPLEDHEKTHYVYTNWRGFAWLDIQTGIRATQLCQAFRVFVHAEAFTPEFLGVFLASLYDHQVKTEHLPMGVVHNKAVFEQRGFINIAYTFPEFKDARRWMELAMGRVRENFLAQTTSDGVQREWSAGYHLGVLRDAVEIMERMKAFDIEVPQDYQDRIRAMYDYIFAMAAPDLSFPMFGDAGRAYPSPEKRIDMELYSKLVAASELLDDPKYKARAVLDAENLPAQTSYAFHEAGMYALRNQWGPDQVYLALHCSPPAISGHDQPDNGTFELWAYGRWLMTDSGYYTYGHDPEARAWHRQTRAHQTLTLDGKDTKVGGRELLWQVGGDGPDVLVVENASYEGLTHRRTVWFVGKRFFVLLDEAIGDAPGALDLNFQFAPGDVHVDLDKHCATTAHDDANIIVWQAPDAPVTVAQEDGWFAWSYGKRTPRTAIRFRHNSPAPAAYLTILYPYRGTDAPDIGAALADDYTIGADHVALTVATADGQTWQLTRDLTRP